MGKQKITKKQHYVPQFYLRKWCSDNKLWCYDLKNAKIYRAVPKDCCFENYFYEIGKIGNDFVLPNTREQDYQRIESEIAPIINNKLKIMDDEKNKNALIFDSYDKKLMIDFVLTMIIRNKDFNNNDPTFIRDVYNAEAGMIKEIDEILNIQVDEEFNQKFVEYIMKSPNFERLDVTNPKSKTQLGGYFYHQLRDCIKDYYFSIAETDDCFCTSCNPVMYTSQVVFFPLSPRYALFFRKKNEDYTKNGYRINKLVYLSHNDAVDCSTEYLARKDRFLFANDEKTLRRVLQRRKEIQNNVKNIEKTMHS